MMSVESTALENPNNGNKRLTCPLYGCKRVYTDTNALQSHIKDHEIPAQSLPGKVMMCSTVGCSSSFPNMQKLMEHMRHHHKPNTFFLCESCHAKLRSYRGLLHHLRACSKVPRSKTNPALAAAPMAVDPNPAPQIALSIGTPPQLPLQILALDQAASSLNLSNLDLTPPHLIAQQLIESIPPPPLSDEPPQTASTLNPEVQPAPNTTNAQLQQHLKPLEHASRSKPIPQTPPGTVRRSSQAPISDKRILWQHTRGRYTCVQCGYTVTHRKEMAEHSNTHHGDNNKPTEETASSASTSA